MLDYRSRQAIVSEVENLPRIRAKTDHGSKKLSEPILEDMRAIPSRT